MSDLEIENERLLQKVNALKSSLVPRDEYRQIGVSFGLTKAEADIFSLLLVREVVNDKAYSAVRVSYDEIDPGCLKVLVHRMRKKLSPRGINIKTVKGLGYRLTYDDRAKVKSGEFGVVAM